MESTRGKGEAVKRPEAPSKSYIDRAVQFIHYNYATIRVQDIVDYVGFTRSYFTSLFRKWTGQSPQEYLIQYRLNTACRALLETSWGEGEETVRESLTLRLPPHGSAVYRCELTRL